ncbi:four-carbon acid sugar kinase family protein [Arthrobacter sp. ISL-65]|uniref:four-carbon acid sugar kinase family protein n=1 Tax=Arthrobacter sp. ISL-65 TaxID=2819112 RepID=UPI001BE73B41|nr:four-carbon acid sugar kinase family protein [Arthrobacter sp. ISL-65]MBT2550825.1 hypothetical protein [Arthrobacter sp. ISL-65]
MKTVVLDDDPTGTQSASDVGVLLDFNQDLIAEALTTSHSVYIQTNSRAIDEEAARKLVAQVREDSLTAGAKLGEDIQFVLRGDSTLRGHVFAESEVFLSENSIILFVPAFPDGGRTTRGGVHYVNINGIDMAAHETEYALDPVFPFSTGKLDDYVKDKSGRPSVLVGLDEIRAGTRLAQLLVSAEPGTVILPDAETNDDIRLIARAVQEANEIGASIVIRCAAPLAAALADVESAGLLAAPLVLSPSRTLLVCGSHTAGATAQLAALEENWGHPRFIDTEEALNDPVQTGRDAAEYLKHDLETRGFAMVASGRHRSGAHNTLNHGERVMAALATAVQELANDVDIVIAKGGITSAEVARHGLSAKRAHVLGQVLPGVSVWSIDVSPEHAVTYIVVPGNVGSEDTLTNVVAAVGR